MPNAFDIGKYTTDFNPIAGGPFVSIQDVMASFGDVFQEIIQLLPQLLNLITQLPEEFLQIVETLFQTFIDFIFPSNGGTSPLITALTGVLGNLIGSGGSGGILQQLVDFVIQIIPQLIVTLTNMIGTTGGSNLITQIVGMLISLLPNILTSITSLIGGTGGASVLGQLVSLAASILTSPLGLLTGFTGGSDILTQLIGAVGGSGTGLTGFANLFGGLGPLSTLFSGFSSGVPLLSQLPALLTLPLTAITGLLGAGGLLSGFSTGSSILTQLPSLLTLPITAITSLAGYLTNMSSGGIFSPSGLGSGALPAGVTALISQIPGLSGLFSGLNTSGSSSLLAQLPSLLTLPMTAITGLLGLFTGFNTTGSSSLLTQLISAGGGTGSTLTDFGNLLATLATDFASLVAAFIPGFSGGTQGNFNTIIGNLLSMLGNPLNLLGTGSGFNPIGAVQQFAQSVGVPAGLLSSSSWLPLHTLGNLNATGGTMTNALQNADPGFSDPTRFSGNGVWTLDLTLDHTGVAGSGSAKAIADGALLRLSSVPVAVGPGANITLGKWVHWLGLSTSAGNAIRLAVNAFDANDLFISNQIVSAIASPPSSSTGYSSADAINPANILTADANGWVYLSGAAVTPANTAYVTLCAEVGACAVAGQVNVDDLAIYLPGLVDASLLHNFGNMNQGAIPGFAQAGFQNLADIPSTLGHLFDGLGTAFSLVSQSGLTFANLFGLAQNSAVDSANASQQSIVNTNILNFRQNQPSSAGANLTTEAMISLPHFGSGGTQSTLAVPAGTAIMQKFNPAAVAQKGFVEFEASLPAGTSGGVFLNIFKWSGTQWNSVWASTDLTSQIQTTIVGIIRALIPSGSQPTMNAGEQYMIGLANNTASTLTVVGMDTGTPNNGNETIPNMGGTRTLSSSGGATPSTLANSAITYSGKVPYFGVGILNVPASYVPPQQFTDSTPGTRTYTIPTFARVAGATIDVAILGPGGGGQANYGALIWFTGGNAGAWATITLTCGVDYPVGATSITYTVGTKGLAAGAYWTNGHKGTDTSITWNDGTNNHTLTAAAGEGGGNTGTSGTNGKSPGNKVYNGVLYPGGAEVGGNATGSPPGGGGGGAGPYQTGGDGADGVVNFRAAQPA